ncbi:unnamed protein product [marine sediment metagenome]|uniref:CobQ/CobB/MinD/ParA nucleotide binding domain-containing protein n=1 Tax=marine sediment metagenome TaxID=412755 RepID=X1EFK7_9ZZZZ
MWAFGSSTSQSRNWTFSKERARPTAIVVFPVPPLPLATEPTPFGLNDLVLAVETLRKLKIPFGVVINRADVGDKKVDEYCQDEKIPILMRIPLDRDIAIAYSKGIPVIEAKPAYKGEFINLYSRIEDLTPD